MICDGKAMPNPFIATQEVYMNTPFHFLEKPYLA